MNKPSVLQRRYVGPKRKGYQAYHEKLRQWHDHRTYSTPESLQTAMDALHVKGDWEYRLKPTKE